jgi:glycosyltransferase involved in cell wall biosynthesis
VTTALRRLASVPSRLALGAYVPARTASWPESSRLFVLGDDIGWSIDDDRARLTATARRLGYEVAPSSWAGFAKKQAVFNPSHFDALRPRWTESSHRLGLSYFHGRPGTDGYPEFDEAFDRLRRHADRIERVHVTHAEMHELAITAGVPASNVFRIPIGVEVERFPLGDAAARAESRGLLGLPESAFVVGSFVKDGVGLGLGSEPKLLKGPDILVATLDRLRSAIPELFVLLTGLSRGYVLSELERLGVPHRHVYLRSRDELARAYHALDAYLVTSRQEGGPKASLEAPAAGVPLVTTRVGQAQELLVDEAEALLADVDDVDALSAAVQRVYDDAALASRLRTAARAKAETLSDERLDTRWEGLLDGFVRRGD